MAPVFIVSKPSRDALRQLHGRTSICAHASWQVLPAVLIMCDAHGHQRSLSLQAGGQGHADVAVTCLLPLDEGHLAPAADDFRRPGAPKGSNSPFRRVLNSVAASAAKAAQAIVEDALGRGQGAGEHVRLRCALMRLSLPVELLAAQLLQLPLHEAASDM